MPESYILLPTLLAGDFNLLYSRWQPSLQRPPTNFAATFLEWLDRLGLLLTSEVDIPTHDKGNILDLAFISSSPNLLGTSTKVVQHLDATSNYHPLLTLLPWGQQYIEAHQRLQFNTLDHDCFLTLLTSNLDHVRNSAENRAELDCLAEGITSAIHSAYTASANKSIPQGRGQSWWNLECKEAL